MAALSPQDTPEEDLAAKEAYAALERLAALGRQTPAPALIDHSQHRRQAAVLVALFLGRKSTIYVLLSRRSKTLRGYPGDTALPGGKVDPTDLTLEATARREAYEEIGLLQDKNKVVYLCHGDEDISREGMPVTPIVVWIKDKTLIPELNHSEVTDLFALPLSNFLSSTSPFPPKATVAQSARPYYGFFDVDLPGRRLRRHQFLTNREELGIQPVRGLTASILIDVACKAFDRVPDFSLEPERIDEDVGPSTGPSERRRAQARL